MSGAADWDVLLRAGAAAFTRPSFLLFWTLVSAWVLCPGHRTVTRMIGVADPEGEHAHDAYHRFLRAGAWTMTALWQVLLGLLVTRLAPTGVLHVDLDDTLFHKAGRKIDGVGIFRDPVRSTARSVVYALGLNVVVLTLRVTPPWGGEPLGLPINLRLYRKGGPSHLELGAGMLRELATWLPEHAFALTCDGAYAPLAGMDLTRTHVTSRMRRDAAVYMPPPPRKRRQRGRPRKRGRRLPSPTQMARRTIRGWVSTTIDVRGKTVERVLLCRPVLWYHVCPTRLVLLVIMRDPTRTQPDDFFFTTDLSASPAAVASEYLGRWSIEDTFRSVKQTLGGEDPQTWKAEGPERAAALSCWIYAAVCCGTSRRTVRNRRGPPCHGIRRSARRPLLMRSPRSAAPCGANAFPRTSVRNRSRQKSGTVSSRSSREPHNSAHAASGENQETAKVHRYKHLCITISEARRSRNKKSAR